MAVLYDSVVPVVAKYGDALAGKAIIDISNPFNSEADGLAIREDTSIAQEVAQAAPASASVVKAFNTIFGHVLEKGRPLAVFIAGDDAQAKAGVEAFIESLGLRPLYVGGLTMAHWLEGAGLLMMGLARHGVGEPARTSPSANRISRLNRTAPGPSCQPTRVPCAPIMVDESPKGLADARHHAGGTRICPERIPAMKLGFALPIVGPAESPDTITVPGAAARSAALTTVRASSTAAG